MCSFFRGRERETERERYKKIRQWWERERKIGRETGWKREGERDNHREGEGETEVRQR